MAIQKQQFYEGAALHSLARSGMVEGLRYDPPFFVLNDRILLLLKYSTKTRSPWGFTFSPRERDALAMEKLRGPLTIGLVCGDDGIAACSLEEYRVLTSIGHVSARISCFRSHGGLYQLSGPEGRLRGKISPSRWQRLLEE